MYSNKDLADLRFRTGDVTQRDIVAWRVNDESLHFETSEG